jgi:2-iminoacetate synthase
MSPRFSEVFSDLPIDSLEQASVGASTDEVDRILNKGRIRNLEEFALMLSPAASGRLEDLSRLSQQSTRKHFGKVVRLFAPLYLSNECVNICKYCGFSRNNPIPRITLPVEKVGHETSLLARQGFRSLLLVAGEHPKFVSGNYIQDCIRQCLKHMPSILIEIAPMETEDYRPIVEAGSEGVVVYQETYDRETYREMHPHGPKKNFDWRLDSVERGYEAGFRRLGIGALFGLHDWRHEALALATHAQYLSRKCCNAQLSISFPRMRPAAGEFEPKTRHLLGDRDLVQLVAALRIFLPHAAFVLSTRESPQFRDGIFPLGITNMSAGSSTEPGAYSDYEASTWKPGRAQPGEQFHIADERSPAEVAQLLRNKGYEPVWKDFDATLVTAEKTA